MTLHEIAGLMIQGVRLGDIVTLEEMLFEVLNREDVSALKVHRVIVVDAGK